MNIKQTKALLIVEQTMRLANCIADIHSEKIQNAHLLKKQIFPNRRIPNRLKRKLKAIARKEISKRAAITVLQTAIGASQIAMNLSNPIPNYESGSHPNFSRNPSFFLIDENDCIIGRNGGNGTILPFENNLKN